MANLSKLKNAQANGQTNDQAQGNQAFLLFLYTERQPPENELAEFINLAKVTGVRVRGCMQVRIREVSARYFIGVGKAQEVCRRLRETNTRLLLVSKNLSPLQERELERLCQVRVLSRSGLILDIFSQSASSYQGKLQVELAQLTYLSTRLVRGWSHLERQKGGIGLRGPGEKQLETDRRLCRQRIKQIKKKIEKIKSQRKLGQQRRHKNNIPTIALVGYTNAGKSALFNQMSHAQSRVADIPFATLDPCLRRVFLDPVHTAIVSDTVGFVHDLPPVLIDAFHASLQSVSQAQLLLHVVDLSCPDYAEQEREVESILKTIDADQLPCLKVYNKIDCVEQEAEVVYDSRGVPRTGFVSAKTGAGITLLKQAIVKMLVVGCVDSEPWHEHQTQLAGNHCQLA